MFIALPSNAQEERWFDGIFFDVSGLYYFAPDLLSEFIKTEIGFRGAAGYEFKGFRFGIESGFSRIEGTNPLVKEILFTPLVFKFGYAFPIYSIFGLQANAGAGFLFSKVLRYETAIDKIRDNKIENNESSFLGEARIYALITPLKFLNVYIGGGADFIFENDGIIPLPVIEAGVSIKPFAFITGNVRSKKIIEPNPQEIIFESRSENIIIEENERGKTVRLLNAVYFEADTAVMIERYRPILNTAGERLRANPSLQLTLRGYAAPFGSTESLIELSSARARFCAEYLTKEYGIAAARMKLEYYGAQRAPEFRDASWESYRCVEFIIQ